MSSWHARTPGAPPLIVGHRGSSAVEPENSLAAFERAGADGADGVELDVLLCATGEVVVFHDDDLIRLAARRDRIDRLPLSAIRVVKLTSGATIPTLEEALEACGATLLVNVELKASGLDRRGMRALVAGVEAAISRSGAGARILISSFHPLLLSLWRGLPAAARIPRGFLFERDARWFGSQRRWTLRWLRPLCAHPEKVLCTPAAVQAWHRRGYLVNVWTVDGDSEVRGFRDMGVDGIITNDPGRARRAIESRS